MRRPTPSDFRHRLRALMRHRGLNANQLSILCRKAGYVIDPSMISRYLARSTEARFPSLRSLIAIAAGLRCSLDQLVGGRLQKELPDKETQDALKFWRAYQDMPACAEKTYIAAKLHGTRRFQRRSPPRS